MRSLRKRRLDRRLDERFTSSLPAARKRTFLPEDLVDPVDREVRFRTPWHTPRGGRNASSGLPGWYTDRGQQVQGRAEVREPIPVSSPPQRGLTGFSRIH